MLRIHLITALMLFSGALGVAHADEPQNAEHQMREKIEQIANRPVTLHRLRDGAYWVSGGISNSGFVIGEGGVTVIDGQMFVPAAQKEVAAIRDITSAPIHALILTHSDPDHLNGLPGWPKGMEIFAHENAAVRIDQALVDPSSAPEPAPPQEIRDYRPTRRVKSSEDLILDGVRVQLIHVAPAHTDEDIVVYLPDQKVAFTGDLLTPNAGAYPILHRGPQVFKNGSARGWIAFMKVVAKLDADVFVPGHGDPLTKADIKKRLHMAEMRHADIAAMIKRGLSLEQIEHAFRNDPKPIDVLPYPGFTDVAYRELTGQ